MQYYPHVATALTLLLAFSSLTSSAPPQSAFSDVPSSNSDHFVALPQSFNNSARLAVAERVNVSFPDIGHGSSLTNLSAEVNYWTVTWTISDTLYLTINVGAWELAPEKILQTLEAAEISVGKQQASALLDGKFTQETGSRINSMIFEISPPRHNTRLTWADVGDILGENGLIKFFKEKQEWHSVYFDVIDKRRGELGQGAVRKWYMLEPSRNVTGLGSS